MLLLDGKRGLDLSRFQACPLCGMSLADMRAEGKRIFRELVKHSDIVLHNFTSGVPIAKNVNYESLKKINESTIVTAVSGGDGLSRLEQEGIV
jgi:crotonobetainyl-CoA:carnitine CoA-transferase CaiB-like acyl-CoA transferase